MNKRQFKKHVQKMSDSELNEHVAYCENERKRVVFEIEYVSRNPEFFEGLDEEWGF